MEQCAISKFFLATAVALISAIASVETLDQGHECARPCANGGAARRCRYEFFVGELPGASRICNASREGGVGDATCAKRALGVASLVINGMSPGPAIEMCLGDTLEVLLYNGLANAEVSMHWHGIRQKGSVHMDGVGMVSQCPVLPYQGFRYEMKPETAGTYFYHAHSVPQHGDGLYGSLTVRDSGSEPSRERSLLVSSRPRFPLSRPSHERPGPKELLVNGQTDGVELFVDTGNRYLLRFINANVFPCPVSVAVAGHRFSVSSSDGNTINRPTSASRIVLFPGERIDAVFEANQSPGKYLIGVQGLQECRGAVHEAFLIYNGAEINSAVMREPDVYLPQDRLAFVDAGHDCRRASEDIVCALDLKGPVEEWLREEPETRVYVPFDVNELDDITDAMSDYKYNIYEFTYYPAFLSVTLGRTKLPQINGMTFKYPPSPILAQPENTPDDMVCSLEKPSEKCGDTPLFCECLQIFEVPPWKNIEVILIDEGTGSNVSHVFHVHGYEVSVVGFGSFGRPISKDEIRTLDTDGRLPRNLDDPPKKDTFVVPNKGYAILRFHTDNLGYWLWEARSTGVSPALSGPGMQFLMRVGTRENLPTVPIDFPTCGNNKGPDMIFEAGVDQ